MANVKNFGLVGVGSSVQYGKAGPSLAANSATVLQATGSAAFMVPLGNNAARPTGATGMIRTNNESTPILEYYNGTTWVSLATGGAAVTSVSGTTDRITSTGGTTPVIDIASTYVGQTSITTLGTVGTGTWQGSVVAPAYGGTGVANDPGDTITLGGAVSTGGALTTAGAFTQAGAFATTITSTATTSVTLPTSGTLLSTDTIASNAVTSFQTSLSGLTPSTATNGVVTLAGTLGGASGGTGVNNGSSTITLGGSLTTVGAFATSITSTAATSVTLPVSGTLLSTDSTYVASVSGTATRIVIGGTATNPTVDLATVTNPGTGGTFVKVTTDGYGRVTDSTAVLQADITGLVDTVYVNVAGDTMTGDLNMGNFYVTMNNAPVDDTDAANKAYVDSIAAGLSWKQAVASATTVAAGNISGFSAGVITIPNNNATFFPNVGAAAVIDAVTFVANQRVLVKNQTTTAQNGIYIVTTVGVEGSVDAVLTRASDMNAPAEFTGATVFVTGGTVNDNSGWTQTAIVTTVNTDPVVWAQFSGSSTYTWGTGLLESGNTISVNLGAGITELPSDEVGIHLYDSANNPLILTTDGTARSTATGAALDLLLDGSSLSKSTTGLRVAAGGVDLTTMVTGVLPGANGGTGVANTGKTITLGGSLTTAGAFDSTFTMTAATSVTFPTSGTLATVGGTVASFSAGTTGLLPNSATTGAVTLTGTLIAANGGTGFASYTVGDILYADTTTTLAKLAVGAAGTVLKGGTTPTYSAVSLTADVTGTLPVANGGTGAATLLDTGVLIGNGTTAIEATTALTFDSTTDVLTIGGATGVSIAAAGTDVIITALATNSDINLIPNGTGTVNIGAAGAGAISSDSGQALTVTGSTILTLASGTGDIVMNLSGTTNAVTVTGPTAAQYAANVVDADLVNKYYVDQAIATGGTGDVKAVQATVNLGANASTNIGAALPAGATILSVKVNVTVVNTTSTLVVGKSGGSQYMIAAENDPQTTGLYMAETLVTEGSSEQVQATVAGQTGGVGSCEVIVTYKLA